MRSLLITFSLLLFWPIALSVDAHKSNAKAIKVNATAYCQGYVTATGSTPRHLRTVAVSRSLEKILPMGSKIRIRKYGNREFIVSDRMSRRWKEHRIDIYMNSRKDAIHFGKRKVIVEKIRR